MCVCVCVCVCIQFGTRVVMVTVVGKVKNNLVSKLGRGCLYLKSC